MAAGRFRSPIKASEIMGLSEPKVGRFTLPRKSKKGFRNKPAKKRLADRKAHERLHHGR